MPKGIELPPDRLANELEEATRACAAEVAAGRPGVVLSRGPAGFAMVVGAKGERVVKIEGGVMLAYGFDRKQLAGMYARIGQLLGVGRG